DVQKPEKMKNLRSLIYCLGLVLNLMAFPVSGQPIIDAKELEKNFYKTRKTSEEIVKDYIWYSRTDVTKEGKVMDILIEECRYGPNGKLQRRIINDQEAKLPSSFLVHQIAEEMKTKMVTFMNDLHVFLEKYSLDDATLGSAFFSKAKIGSPDPNGQVLVSSEDVIIKGDKLLWWIDLRDNSITKASIVTTFNGDQVEFTATYKYIPSGLQYMTFAEILVPLKSLIVQLHFYDYTKID
ncbi:MAG: hypothetical protein Q8867_09890, partial [Bacteroidota bacterium]|nr:hypothetical protein [Bacteroidota bacterium]